MYEEGSAAAFISEDKKILLHNREKDGKSRFGEKWSLIGGRKENNETQAETLIREIKEELGYEIEKYTYFGDYFSKKGNLLVHVFIVDFPGVEAFSETKEGDIRGSLKLFSCEEVPLVSALGTTTRICNDLRDKGYLK